MVFLTKHRYINHLKNSHCYTHHTYSPAFFALFKFDFGEYGWQTVLLTCEEIELNGAIKCLSATSALKTVLFCACVKKIMSLNIMKLLILIE